MTTRLERAIYHRRNLHLIPEAGLHEVKTRAYLMEHLSGHGATLYTDVYSTGLVAVFEFKKNAPTLVFRADMDALSIHEKTNHSFKSEHEGMMHACGHDGHMTILLVLAEQLSSQKLKHVNIALVFQPAEEGPGGALGMIESGLFNTMNVIAVFGIHVFPGLEHGKMGTTYGPMMAATSEIRVKFKGLPSHGAQPHLGRDSLVAGASFLLNAQTIISRSISPMDSAVVSFGRFFGGERLNIVSPESTLEGTMRSFKPEVHGLIQAKLNELVESTSLAFGVEGEIQFDDMYPAVINDQTLAKVAFSVLDNLVEISPEMLAEDFSYFNQIAPSLFMFLGINKKTIGTFPLHSDCFDFDEEALLYGVESFFKLIHYYEDTLKRSDHETL